MWFRKKKQSVKEQAQLQKVVSVELKHHEDLSKQDIARTQKIAEDFNKVIAQNGFTLKIHVAAGGKK